MPPSREALSDELDSWTQRRDWHESAIRLCDKRIEATLGELALMRQQGIYLVPPLPEGEQDV